MAELTKEQIAELQKKLDDANAKITELEKKPENTAFAELRTQAAKAEKEAQAAKAALEKVAAEKEAAATEELKKKNEYKELFEKSEADKKKLADEKAKVEAEAQRFKETVIFDEWAKGKGFVAPDRILILLEKYAVKPSFVDGKLANETEIEAAIKSKLPEYLPTQKPPHSGVAPVPTDKTQFKTIEDVDAHLRKKFAEADKERT